MAVFLCPHCDDLIELLGDERRPAPQCDCGGLMEPADADEADHRDAFFRPALDLSDPVQRDEAVRGMLAWPGSAARA